MSSRTRSKSSSSAVPSVFQASAMASLRGRDRSRSIDYSNSAAFRLSAQSPIPVLSQSTAALVTLPNGLFCSGSSSSSSSSSFFSSSSPPSVAPLSLSFDSDSDSDSEVPDSCYAKHSTTRLDDSKENGPTRGSPRGNTKGSQPATGRKILEAAKQQNIEKEGKTNQRYGTGTITPPTPPCKTDHGTSTFASSFSSAPLSLSSSPSVTLPAPLAPRLDALCPVDDVKNATEWKLQFMRSPDAPAAFVLSVSGSGVGALELVHHGNLTEGKHSDGGARNDYLSLPFRSQSNSSTDLREGSDRLELEAGSNRPPTRCPRRHQIWHPQYRSLLPSAKNVLISNGPKEDSTRVELSGDKLSTDTPNPHLSVNSDDCLTTVNSSDIDLLWDENMNEDWYLDPSNPATKRTNMAE